MLVVKGTNRETHDFGGFLGKKTVVSQERVWISGSFRQKQPSPKQPDKPDVPRGVRKPKKQNCPKLPGNAPVLAIPR